MEKALLKVRESKKGKIVAELQFVETKKKMPFPQFGKADLSLDGTEVEVERDKGKIVKVIAGDDMIYRAAPAAPPARAHAGGARPAWTGAKDRNGTPRNRFKGVRTEGPMQTTHVSNIRYAAHAPYNFVPLNETIVEVDRDEIPPFDKYHENRRTGWVEVEIETRTPLFIRGALNEGEVSSGKKSKDKPDFYSPGGALGIPGSSLRGMVRNLVEIVSFGKFENVDDKRLYFRGLADKSNLRKEYQGAMSSYDRKRNKSIYKFSAGVLRLKGDGVNYEIASSGGNFKQIYKDKAKKLVLDQGGTYSNFRFYNLKNQYLVVSGDMQNKKRDWLIDFPKSNAPIIPVPREDVRNYLDDITRAEEAPNLIQLAAKGVPCFYVKWRDAHGNDRVSFGHTGMFRLAYRKTIGEHVPLPGFKIDRKRLTRLKESKIPKSALNGLNSLMDKSFSKTEFQNELENLNIEGSDIHKIMAHASIIDIPEAIFGNEKTFAGRVFFEDAFLNKGEADVLMGEGAPRILSSPKPTTFQHYLVQSGDNNRALNHYNSPAAIRGHKLYWHKSGNNWRETDRQALEKHGPQYTRINPVRPGVRFTGRIRFENLSDVELGALLFALDLPKGCCHKLGMGKPLGMGSVKITSRLYLSNRTTLRYTDLFSEWRIDESDEIPGLKQAFGMHICKEIGETKTKNPWEAPRLRELKTMLHFETGARLESKNSYMSISPPNEFKDRRVLPLPANV